MLGSEALDVVFGLIFVYLVLSLLCSALNETLASVLAWRAKMLREGVRNFLGDDATAESVYGHPLIRSLTRKRGGFRIWAAQRVPGAKRLANDRYPSYLPSRTFALALLDRLGAADRDEAKVEKALASVPNAELRDALLTIHRDVDGRYDDFKERVSEWYDEGMERVSGWYRRRVQLFLWLLAIVVAASLNADTFQLARVLWKDDTIRAAVVAQAEGAVQPGAEEAQGGEGTQGEEEPQDLQAVATEVEKVPELVMPLGWTTKADDPREVPDDLVGWLIKLAGLLATAAALTFGAPFWFDLLRRVAQVRSAGRPPPAAKATRRREDDGDEG